MIKLLSNYLKLIAKKLIYFNFYIKNYNFNQFLFYIIDFFLIIIFTGYSLIEIII